MRHLRPRRIRQRSAPRTDGTRGAVAGSPRLRYNARQDAIDCPLSGAGGRRVLNPTGFRPAVETGYNKPMNARILVVEDMEDNLELFRDVLQMAGYEVLSCMDGLSAVQCAITQRPDLVLMDISLPFIDGHEATRRIRSYAATRHVPIIAVTAHAMPVDRENALAAGCSAYIAKPVSPRVLLQVIAEHLARK